MLTKALLLNYINNWRRKALFFKEKNKEEGGNKEI